MMQFRLKSCENSTTVIGNHWNSVELLKEVYVLLTRRSLLIVDLLSHSIHHDGLDVIFVKVSFIVVNFVQIIKTPFHLFNECTAEILLHTEH